MTYLGCKQDVHAYILRTIRAQIEPAHLSKLGCEFVPLNQNLFEKLEVRVTVFLEAPSRLRTRIYGLGIINSPTNYF